MKVERIPREQFNILSDKPVEIRPFDPQSKRQAFHYLARLNDILAPFGVAAELFGSVELEIAGKGEWEFAVWLTDQQWYPVLIGLINHFGSIYTLSDDFALFEDSDNGTNIEIIPMRGEAAEQNQAVMKFWRTHPDALKAYEQAKYQYAHSKREYYWWKNNFIADILESL
ncbi:MAG: hypothetical protein L0332_32505 [Chloroflexi bacterium]|nr:hypothetical protein [Chloroflexota bacterium]MCI0644849.1 hypothetical protein [Chloroflexota bacterium]MCI0731425.1 hypothetical protein [Chloroflexota bacterium]